MPFVLLTLLLGWWGIPWGPIRSIASIVTNIAGGTDVTFAVLESMPMLCAPHEGKAAGE